MDWVHQQGVPIEECCPVGAAEFVAFHRKSQVSAFQRRLGAKVQAAHVSKFKQALDGPGKARLGVPHAADWLRPEPTTTTLDSLHLPYMALAANRVHMTANQFRVAVLFRLGLDVVDPTDRSPLLCRCGKAYVWDHAMYCKRYRHGWGRKRSGPWRLKPSLTMPCRRRRRASTLSLSITRSILYPSMSLVLQIGNARMLMSCDINY